MGAAPDKGKKVRLVQANQIISTWERNRAMLSYSGNVLRKGAAGGEKGGEVRDVTSLSPTSQWRQHCKYLIRSFGTLYGGSTNLLHREVDLCRILPLEMS